MDSDLSSTTHDGSTSHPPPTDLRSTTHHPTDLRSNHNVPTTHQKPLREALIEAPLTTSPFSMKGKFKLAKVAEVLREDTLTAIMPCDGVLTMFLIKLKGVGCWPDLASTRGSKLHAMRHLAALSVSKIVSLKCYFHTLNNELVCSARLEDGTDLSSYLLDNNLVPPFNQTADVAYRPLAIHPPVGHPPVGSVGHPLLGSVGSPPLGHPPVESVGHPSHPSTAGHQTTT